MTRQHSIVITHMCQSDRLPKLSELEERFGIDQGEWIVLTHQNWQALAGGDGDITDDLERKLLTSFFIRQPQIIVVVGSAEDAEQDIQAISDQTRRVLGRVRDCLLPTDVIGVVIDSQGRAEQVEDDDDVFAPSWNTARDNESNSPLVGSAG